MKYVSIIVIIIYLFLPLACSAHSCAADGGSVPDAVDVFAAEPADDHSDKHGPTGCFCGEEALLPGYRRSFNPLTSVPGWHPAPFLVFPLVAIPIYVPPS